MTRKTRIVSAALAATSLMAAMPTVGHAASFTFVSRLDHEPSNSAPGHNCKEDGSDDPTPTCTRVAIDQSFAAPGALTLRLAKLMNAGFTNNGYSALGMGDGTGPTVNVQGRGFDENEANAIESFPANLQV